jgi:hypothetical protein
VDTQFSVKEKSFELLVKMEGEKIESRLALMVDGGEECYNSRLLIAIILIRKVLKNAISFVKYSCEH